MVLHLHLSHHTYYPCILILPMNLLTLSYPLGRHRTTGRSIGGNRQSRVHPASIRGGEKRVGEQGQGRQRSRRMDDVVSM